jgi:hypothetical protein
MNKPVIFKKVYKQVNDKFNTIKTYYPENEVNCPKCCIKSMASINPCIFEMFFSDFYTGTNNMGKQCSINEAWWCSECYLVFNAGNLIKEDNGGCDPWFEPELYVDRDNNYLHAILVDTEVKSGDGMMIKLI